MKQPASRLVLHTIGHSNHSLETFCQLLRMHGIQVLCDVRSHPSSRYCPQYNRPALLSAMNDEGLRYVYLGAELGGRQLPNLNIPAQERYALVAQKPSFVNACNELRTLLCRGMRVALMCAEQDPLHCHRNGLVCQHLPYDAEIRHILRNGAILQHDDIIQPRAQQALL